MISSISSDSILQKDDFDEILNFATKESIKLIICDFNGVLDDYYAQKYTYLESILGNERKDYLAALAVFTDTEYMRERTTTLETSVQKFFLEQGWQFGEREQLVLAQGMGQWSMTHYALQFIQNLPSDLHLVIYTSQLRNTLQKALPLAALNVKIYSRDVTGREKPSVENLAMICRENNVQPHDVCVIGDGLIDDLMPAKLFGTHTLLVSPFADKLQSI